MYTEKDLDFFSKSAFVDSALLHTFLSLNMPAILSEAAPEGISLSQLSASLHVHPRGLRLLVEVLCASNVLVLDEQQRVTLHPAVRAILTDAEALERFQAAAQWWWPAQQLTTAVRTGKAVQTSDGKTWDLLAYYAAQLLSPASEQADPAFQQLFDRVACNFLRTQLLVCVAQLHLLAHFYQQEQTLPRLQERCHASQEGLRVLLAILVKFGVLQQHAETYSFAPYFEKHMSKLAVKAYTYTWNTSAKFWDAFGHLEKALCTDEPRLFNLQDQAVSDPFYYELAKYNTLTFPAYYRITRQIAERLAHLKSLQQCAVLDVGAGSGAWGAGFMVTEPTAQVTFLDQQLVLSQTQSNMEKLKLQGQMRFWVNDVPTADYGEHCFDVIILGFVCHTQPLQQLAAIFARLARALRPDGLILIADWCVHEQHTGPLDLLYFSFKEFVTTQGELLSVNEYRQLFDTVALKLQVATQVAGFDLLVVSHRETSIVIPQDMVW